MDLSYRLIGDGATDKHDGSSSLAGPRHRTIHVLAGDYAAGKLNISSKTILILKLRVTIRDSARRAEFDRFINTVGVEERRGGQYPRQLSGRLGP